jgi:hypothetical protein
VINIHIPRTGTPMDVQSCDESFARAKAFFAEETGEVCAFVCSSWLLYPEHEQMLSHESNVYKFMKRFDVFRSGTSKGRGDLWRLFDTDEKRFGGQGRIKPQQRFEPFLVLDGGELVQQIRLYLPARTAVVLSCAKGKTD